MPKRKPPPRILRIEDVATGREVRPESFVDDFTGEVLPVVQDDSPMRAVPMPDDVRRSQNLAKLAEQRALLQAVGILPKPKAEAELVAPYVEGMRPVRVVKLGEQRYSLQVEKKPWRRF